MKGNGTVEDEEYGIIENFKMIAIITTIRESSYHSAMKPGSAKRNAESIQRYRPQGG